MPVVLQSPLKSRERILGFGSEGTGKSTGYMSIARACPQSTFYVVDNDNTVDRLLETDFTDVAERGQIVTYDADTFDETKNAVAEVVKIMNVDDWLVIDTIGKIWDQVQEWFIESVFQDDIDDYFLRIRMEKEALKRSSKGQDSKKSLGALEGWLDWPVINQTYHKRISKPLLRCPGHLYLASEANKLQDDDDKGVRELYGPLGSRPVGQKRTGHIMQTVLFFSRTRGGDFKLTTVKDRGRYNWNTEAFGDFAQDYLVATAGWQKAFVQ